MYGLYMYIVVQLQLTRIPTKAKAWRHFFSLLKWWKCVFGYVTQWNEINFFSQSHWNNSLLILFFFFFTITSRFWLSKSIPKLLLHYFSKRQKVFPKIITINEFRSKPMVLGNELTNTSLISFFLCLNYELQ